ncbi:MAG: CapA family protein [Clostridiales bacterium]|jgi:poly-gamma-glutamate synthesis protein (capsule biosynthesis protein)|nr:CapA family protein [Clostridiales bacterium]
MKKLPIWKILRAIAASIAAAAAILSVKPLSEKVVAAPDIASQSSMPSSEGQLHLKPRASEKSRLEAAPSPTQAPSPTASPAPDLIRQALVSVVGDLMVHSWQLDNARIQSTGAYNFENSFSMVRKYLIGSDLALGNLETTFAGPEIGYSDYPMFNTPDSFGNALAGAGFDFLTTANNHSNDKGEAGILRTIQVLDKLGLQHTGTFASQASRDEISIVEANGIRLAIVSYTYGTNGLNLVPGHEYTVNLLDEELVFNDIQRAKALNPDFIVVMPHMGIEYEEWPSQACKDWAAFMFEAGADIVLASHPHVLQPMEFVNVTDSGGKSRTCFVIYSLGNFISSQRTIPRDASIILNLHMEKLNNDKAVLTKVSFIPIWVEFVNKSGVYDIKTLSVNDALKGLDGNIPGLRSGDIARLKAVHDSVTKMYLGQTVPLAEMKNEYFIYSPDSSEHAAS